MKKLAPALLFCALLAACGKGDSAFNGYVEGEYLSLAPTTPGVLETLSVERGQEVAKDAPLFALDKTSLQAALASAQAEVAQAKATFESARNDYRRAQTLVKTNAVSRAELDAKKAAADAAEAAIAMAEQKVVQTKKQLIDAAPLAPAAGRIEDTFFRAGEYVAAGAPVVSLLPPENVKVRFFVPEAVLPRLKQGQNVLISCDGCTDEIKGKISFIASQSEYTPPVIYSVGSRDKLVFMIEARPDVPTPELRPGLPVDIELAEP